MQVLLIVNPTASSVTARTRVVIQKALSADHDLTVAETSRRGHAARLAQGAANAGANVVVVLGGDGTLNEAANGLVGTDTALAPLPGGSTNVFARTLGLPDEPTEATGALLNSLDERAITSVGLGSVNGRYFLFHCGVGFDAAVVEQVEKRGGLKRYAGHPLFIYSAFDTWLRQFDHKNPLFAVHHSDGSVVNDGFFTLCMNTNPYTYLGNTPLDVAPDASLDRPLVVLTIRKLSAAALSSLAVAALRRGNGLASHRRVDYRTDVESAVLKGFRPMPYQVDGDFLGAVDELRFTWRRDALRLVVPLDGI
ncbi:MAG: diacylglycerol kinase family lipid kinase [Acidobacteria bacterium]|nr:diacylglycerol kinase family lipid kinase [Acidobacteriota bacterium]